MKTNFGAKIFVVVALASVLAAPGCRSGWKMSNPFAKAPKASDAQTPSELDELELSAPPENYTTNDRSSQASDDESLAQRGRYEAPESEKTSAGSDSQIAAASSTNSTPASPASNNPLQPTESFQTADYRQNYQNSQSFDVAQSAVVPQNAQSTQSAPSFQPTQTPQATPFDATNANASAQNFAQNQTQNQFSPQSVPSATEFYDFPSPDSFVYPPIETPQTNIASNVGASNAASEIPNGNYSTLNVAAQPVAAPNVPNASPTLAATAPYRAPVAQTSAEIPQPVAASTQPAFVAQNFADYSTPTAPYSPVPGASTNASGAVPANSAPASTPQNASAAGSDAYSDVYYQQQTTSGGFAPGSVGIY